MKEWVKSLFDEGSSISLNRVMVALVIVSAVILSFMSIWVEKPLESIIYALLSAGFGGKVIQKFAEVKRE